MAQELGPLPPTVEIQVDPQAPGAGLASSGPGCPGAGPASPGLGNPLETKSADGRVLPPSPFFPPLTPSFK